jgi:hypothetical protein
MYIESATNASEGIVAASSRRPSPSALARALRAASSTRHNRNPACDLRILKQKRHA